MKLKLADDSAKTTLAYCPWCGNKMDSASCVSGSGHYAEPHSGDYSVCIRCGAFLVFKDDLSLRKADAMDIREMSSEQHMALLAISKVVKGIRRK
jgi:hypothetical protein